MEALFLAVEKVLPFGQDQWNTVALECVSSMDARIELTIFVHVPLGTRSCIRAAPALLRPSSRRSAVFLVPGLPLARLLRPPTYGAPWSLKKPYKAVLLWGAHLHP
jgi:hypothetical protein